MNRSYIVKVKNIALTKLRKAEVYTLYNEVIDIIKELETESMHIDTVSEVLIGMHDKAELLNITNWQSETHPLTEKLAKLREERFKFAALITNQIKTAEKANFKGTEPYIELAKPVVQRFLINLRKNNQEEVTQIVMQFFEELEDNPQLKEAFDKLGFTIYLDELKAAQVAFMETYARRREQKSKEHKGSTLPIQRELANVVKILFDQVDYYQHVYKDIDYSHLISSINYVITSYNKVIKTRTTKRTNRKIKAIEAEQAALEDDLKMEQIAQKQAGTDGDTSAIENIMKANTKLGEKPPIVNKKKR